MSAIFDNAGVGIVEVEGDDHFVAVNDRACTILGYSRQKLLNMNVHELTWPKDRELSDRMNREVRDGIRDYVDYEKRYLKGDGSPLWAHVTVRPIRNANGCWKCSIITIEDITERKRAEEALKTSERHFRELADSMPQIVWASRPDGFLDYYNRKWYELTGAKEGQGGDPSWLPVVHPDDHQKCLDTWYESVRTGKPYQIEYRFKFPSFGEYRWHIGRALPVRDEAGNIVRWYGTCTDIHDLKSAKAASEASEERLRLVLEAAETGWWEWDFTTNTINGDKRVKQLLGVAEDTALTVERIIEQTCPADRAQLQARIAALRANAGEREVEFRTRHPNEDVCWVLAKGRSLNGPAGKPTRATGILMGLTSRKQAEEALRQSEQRLRVFFSSDMVGTIYWNMEGVITDANDKFLQMVGYSREELKAGSMSWSQMTPSEYLQLDGQALQELKSHGVDKPYEKEFLRKDGSRIPIIIGAAMVDAHSGVAFVLDITDRKRAERALAQAREDAEKANSAKDQFLAVLSHELRTPLTPVMAAVSLMERNSPLTGDLRHALDIIRRNVALEARLIDDLLDLTRIVRGKISLERKPVPICTVLERVVEVCRPDIEARKHHFNLRIDSPPHLVHGDVSRLQQIFWNLLKNSIKFTPDGGCIGVHCWAENGQVITEVSDSGIGIEPEALGRIFSAFEQASHKITRQFGGLGLGLAITKRLVEMHSGIVEVRSTGKGQGATFRVNFPLSIEPETKGESRLADKITIEKEAPAARILLVEDHGDTAMMMSALLDTSGYRVKTAADVEQALEALKTNEFDLLISDLGLPDRSGLELMHELRRNGSNIRGIALSGFGREEDVKKSKEAGFLEHLTKPVDFDALTDAVQRVTRAVLPD